MYSYSEQEKKKLKKYEKFGARKMQKFVFKLEQNKYKALHRLFPNYITKFEKRLDKNLEKKLAKTQDENEKMQIKDVYLAKKMLIKRQWNNNQNANYHMGIMPGVDFTEYLNWNKDVHVKSLKGDLIGIAGTATLLALPIGFDIPLAVFLALNGASLFVNAECINLQKYNILRYKKAKDMLQKREEKKEEKLEKECGIGVMQDILTNNIKKPEYTMEKSYDKVIANANLDDLIKLREYIMRLQTEKEKSQNTSKSFK